MQGVGGALLTPGSLSIITTQFSDRKVGGAIGLWSMFTSLTSVAGPLLGGWLAESGLWRVIFFINIPFSAFALWIISRKVPESKNEGVLKLDYFGAALITFGLAGLAYGFIESSERGFAHKQIIIALFVGIASILTFVIYESGKTNPLMPLHLFKSRNFSTANGLTLFLYGALSGLLFFLPLNLVQIQGYSEWEGGLVFSPIVLLIAVLSPVTGNLVEKLGSTTFSHCRSGDNRCWFFCLRKHWRNRRSTGLLAYVPFTIAAPGFRYGNYSSTSYHCCNELC